jgi:hypothetical protein
VCPGYSAEGTLSSTSSVSEPLQEECCLLDISSTTSAAQHMLRRTRYPLPFLFRAAAAGNRRSSGEAESEWDRLDLTHFFLFFLFMFLLYASTLLNSRTRRSTTTLLIRSHARTDVCPHRSRQGVERCRHRRCSKKSSKRVWRSKSITGAIAIRAFSRTQFSQISAR